MLKKIFIGGLCLASLGLQGCGSAISQSSKSEIKTETTPKVETATPRKVEFKNVSFTYDPQILGAVEMEEIAERPLENETDKPDYVAPQHLLFKFKKPKINREATVYVFPIEDYRRMYPAASKYDYRQQFDEELQGLRKAIKDKNYRADDQIPFVVFYDAHQTIQAKVKHSPFQSGHGIFFLTQLDQDFANLVNNEGLTYIFQGITEDEKHYILAEFPVTASFLPTDYYANRFEGYKLPQDSTEYQANEKSHRKYLAKITKRLDVLPPNEFEPNLNRLDEMIASLKIEK